MSGVIAGARLGRGAPPGRSPRGGQPESRRRRRARSLDAAVPGVDRRRRHRGRRRPATSGVQRLQHLAGPGGRRRSPSARPTAPTGGRRSRNFGSLRRPVRPRRRHHLATGSTTRRRRRSPARRWRRRTSPGRRRCCCGGTRGGRPRRSPRSRCPSLLATTGRRHRSSRHRLAEPAAVLPRPPDRARASRTRRGGAPPRRRPRGVCSRAMLGGPAYLLTRADEGDAFERVDRALVRWFADPPHRDAGRDLRTGGGTRQHRRRDRARRGRRRRRRVVLPASWRPAVVLAVALCGELLVFLTTAALIDRLAPARPPPRRRAATHVKLPLRAHRGGRLPVRGDRGASSSSGSRGRGARIVVLASAVGDRRGRRGGTALPGGALPHRRPEQPAVRRVPWLLVTRPR